MKRILFVFLLLLGACAPMEQTPLATMESLQGMINAGGAIAAGEYYGAVTISKGGVYDFSGVTVHGTVTNAASGVTINNLTVRSALGYAGFISRGDNVTVNGLRIFDTQENTGTVGADADGIRVRGKNVKFYDTFIDLDGGTVTATSHQDCVQFETWVGAADNILFDGFTCNNSRRLDGNIRETTGFMIERESTSWSNVTIRNAYVVAFVGVNSYNGTNLTIEDSTFVSTAYEEMDKTNHHNSLGIYSGNNSGVLVFQNNKVLNYWSPMVVTGTRLTGANNIVFCGVPCRSDSGWSHVGQLWDVDPKSLITVTPSPTISPSPTVTWTPTITPSPTPTRTATRTPKPTRTPTPVPNISVGGTAVYCPLPCVVIFK